MQATFRLGTIRGIEVGIHYTWFLVFIAFSFLLAESQYPSLYEDWSVAQYWSVAIASVLLLFFSVLAHEFGHSLVAQQRGIHVSSITLFFFGGVASLDADSESPADEFLIAIAGPIVSVLLGFVFFLAWFGTTDQNEQIGALFGYLAFVNILLAAFNMIPGFPLDGGRVFRAVVWLVTGNQHQATATVTTVGVGFGWLMFGFGLLMLVVGNFVGGLWMVALGWFLQNAAHQAGRAERQEQIFSGMKVRDLMNPAPVTVGPDINVRTLVDDFILARNARGIPVVEHGEMIGIVTVTNVKGAPRQRWDEMKVRQVMTPETRLEVVSPETDATEALEIMGAHDFHQLPVVDGGRLVGLLTRYEIIRYLQARQELGMKV